MDARSSRTDGREFLAVLGLATAGLTAAAVVAFTPWYSPPGGAATIVEVHGPVAPAAQAEGR